MQNPGIEPWKMWGSSQQLTIITTGAPQIVQTVGQLVNITYGRPDTWKFAFFIRPVEANALWAAPPGTNTIIINFSLNFGIGRSTSLISNFLQLTLSMPPVGRAGVVYTKVPEPLFSPAGAGGLTNDWITAQNLQVNANMQELGVAPVGAMAQYEVAAYFSPSTHVRPEWLELKPRFPGGENNGT